MLTKRNLLTGMLALGAAPAIIRTPGLLMPIKVKKNVKNCYVWSIDTLQPNSLVWEKIAKQRIETITAEMGIPNHFLYRSDYYECL